MIKRAILNFGLTIVSAIVFLFCSPPKPEDLKCGIYCSHQGVFGHMIIDDANEFIVNAGSPDMILEKNALRQNRPGYIVAAAFTGRLFVLIDRYIYPLSANPYFLGYILLNLFIIWLTLMILNSIFRELSITNQYIKWAVTIIVLFNPVLKVFIWTAHQQMLTLLVPLLSIYYMVIIFKKPNRIYSYKTIRIAFISGILVLFYGSFPIVYMASLISIGLAWFFKNRYCTKTQLVLLVFAITAAFIMPNFMWVEYCKYRIGSYYHWETEYWRQYVWIIDAYNISVSELIFRMKYYFSVFAKTLIILIPFCAFAALVIIYRRVIFTNRDRLLIYSMVLMNIGIFFLLLFMGGVYKSRMTWNLVPSFLIYTALLVDNRRSTNDRLDVTFLSFSVIYALYTVFSHGPFC